MVFLLGLMFEVSPPRAPTARVPPSRATVGRGPRGLRRGGGARPPRCGPGDAGPGRAWPGAAASPPLRTRCPPLPPPPPPAGRAVPGSREGLRGSRRGADGGGGGPAPPSWLRRVGGRAGGWPPGRRRVCGRGPGRGGGPAGGPGSTRAGVGAGARQPGLWGERETNGARHMLPAGRAAAAGRRGAARGHTEPRRLLDSCLPHWCYRQPVPKLFALTLAFSLKKQDLIHKSRF